MSPRASSPNSYTGDARTTFARMDRSSEGTNTTDDNMEVTDAPDISNTHNTTTSAVGTDHAHRPANNSPARPPSSPTSSDTITANSQASSDTITSPTPKISIRKYTLWKASGITPYSAYLAWKEVNVQHVNMENMVKLKDLPHIREREGVAVKNVNEGMEREKKLKGMIRDRDGLWGTQFV